MKPEQTKAGQLAADHARQVREAEALIEQATSLLTAFFDEHKAASTRDRLAHQALTEGTH